MPTGTTPARYLAFKHEGVAIRNAQGVPKAWISRRVGGDLAVPGVQGRRTLKIRLVNAYIARLHAAAAHDAGLASTFVRVAGLVAPPQTLLRPRVALRVLRAGLHPATGTVVPGKRDAVRAAQPLAESVRSTQRLPLSLSVPLEHLRHITAKRKALSARLLVGSTPDSRRKTHSEANSRCKRLAKRPASSARSW